ncbi:MAG: hypothetical protein HZB51_13645 [Chloroflexi bacterium]|nr:hypothetical protein [Chloroflexota bacterium]
MRHLHLVTVVIALLLVISIWASSGTPTAVATTGNALAAVTPTPAATATIEAGAKEFEDFNPNNFNRSTVIDNEWLPLKPGTQFVYDGYTETEGKRVPHRVVFNVTDLTKVINGVRAVVIYDLDYSDGEPVEKELTFFAQDNDGNVWHLGQYVERYDGVDLLGGSVWLAGYVEGARAGIMMKAKPQLGTPSYSEGYAPPPFNWTDRGRVYQMGQKISVPFNNFDNVLVIEEFSRAEPDFFQLKYYARGVGVVGVGWRGPDPNREILQLVDHFQLSSDALARIRAEALELEKRAYVYGRTQPAEPPGSVVMVSVQQPTVTPTVSPTPRATQPVASPTPGAPQPTVSPTLSAPQSVASPTPGTNQPVASLIQVKPLPVVTTGSVRDDPALAATFGTTVLSIPANTTMWFRFDYQTAGNLLPRPTVFVRLLNGVSRGLGFEIWSPERMQGNWRENKPVGRGTQEVLPRCEILVGDEESEEGEEGEETPSPSITMTCVMGETNDLTWTGGFGASGAYYVRLINPTNAPIIPQMLIGGAGLSECADANLGLPGTGIVPSPDEAFVRVQCQDVGAGLIAGEAEIGEEPEED